MKKERDFRQFAKILRKATSRIEREYFLMPVAGCEDAIYRERVYCYELYHRLREVFEEYRFPYSLAGEVDKNGHPIIYTKIGAIKPDLLVHAPGTMDNNLVVIEVKPIKSKTKDIKKDLKTLAGFLIEANYFKAIHLVYGGSESEIKKYIQRSFEREQIRFEGSLFLFWHKAPGEMAKIFNWMEVVMSISKE